jgi:beta-lactamase superfamily II metal-dependent hydrolase
MHSSPGNDLTPEDPSASIGSEPMVDEADLTGAVLRLGRHGSRDGNPQSHLDVVDPKHAFSWARCGN